MRWLLVGFLFILSSCSKESPCSSTGGGDTADSQSSCEKETGKESPTNPEAPAPAPNPNTPPDSPQNPPVNPPPPALDLHSEIARPVAERVDQFYSRHRELLRGRAIGNEREDSCIGEIAERDTYSFPIAFAVREALKKRKAEIDYVASSFRLPASLKENSLLSNPFCAVTKESLKKTFGNRKIPSANTIKKAQDFTMKLNQLRAGALAGNLASQKDFQKIWTRTFMCLSYAESLTTADSAASERVADQYDLKKYPGVKFYLDPSQGNPDSKFNLGLFQFSPVASGNVQACLRAWNKQFPSCSIDTKAKFSKMVSYLSSARQVFNAFCGVTKVRDMFSIQINTGKATSTHPENILSNGALKPAADRCVSPFFRSSYSYNHFGPLQNSTGDNLEPLLTCIMQN
jgi:hypothetical protein